MHGLLVDHLRLQLHHRGFNTRQSLLQGDVFLCSFCLQRIEALAAVLSQRLKLGNSCLQSSTYCVVPSSTGLPVGARPPERIAGVLMVKGIGGNGALPAPGLRSRTRPNGAESSNHWRIQSRHREAKLISEQVLVLARG